MTLNNAIKLLALVSGILLSGCATIVNDPNIPLTCSFFRRLFRTMYIQE